MPDFDPLTCHYCGERFSNPTQRMMHEERWHEDGGGSEKDAMFQAGEPMDIAFRLLKQQNQSSPTSNQSSPTSNRARIMELYPQGLHGPRSRPITPEEKAARAAEDAKECPDCGGLGFVEEMVPDPEEPGEMMWDTPPCTTCNGTGAIA
tara:strand:+ start:2177 stop:2623 length:447 start_codon:yes stop_codon:yes gene_type:complete